MLNYRSKKRILITGVHGFIGKALWRYLHKNGKSFEIFGLSSKVFSPSQRLLRCDFRSPNQLRSVLQEVRPQYILHFVGGRSKNQREEIRLNCQLTKNLLDAVKTIKNFSPRIVVPGSAAEYGIMQGKRRFIRENDPTNPISSYGEAKQRQIQMVLQYAQEGQDIVVARIFNILGEGTPTILSVGHFAYQIAMIERGQKRPAIETESLDGGRDFLDIKDVCTAIFCLMKYGKSGEVYNVCSGKKVVIRQLLLKLIALSRAKNITIKENKTQCLSAFDAVGSNKKIKSLQHWHPQVSLERSLKNTLETYRAYENSGSP